MSVQNKARLQSGNGVDITQTGSALDVNVKTSALAAAAPTTDGIAAFVATNSIMNGTTALTPKFAKANIAASTTDGSIVALVSGKKLRVVQLRLHNGASATSITLQSNSTAISETFTLGANGGRSDAFCPVGLFETASGEALKATTSSGSTVGVGIVYVEV